MKTPNKRHNTQASTQITSLFFPSIFTTGIIVKVFTLSPSFLFFLTLVVDQMNGNEERKEEETLSFSQHMKRDRTMCEREIDRFTHFSTSCLCTLSSFSTTHSIHWEKKERKKEEKGMVKKVIFSHRNLREHFSCLPFDKTKKSKVL